MPDVYKSGELVWAKMKGYSPWPGQITEPSKDYEKPVSNTAYKFVFFFGSKNYAWIEVTDIKPYLLHKDKFEKACKSTAFKKALEEIEEYRKTNETEGFVVPEPVDESDQLKESRSVKTKPKSTLVRKGNKQNTEYRKTNETEVFVVSEPVDESDQLKESGSVKIEPKSTLKYPTRSSKRLASSVPDCKKPTTNSSEDEIEDMGSNQSIIRGDENILANYSSISHKGVGVASLPNRPFTAVQPKYPTRSSKRLASSVPDCKKPTTNSSEDEIEDMGSNQSIIRGDENILANYSSISHKGVGVASLPNRPFTAVQPVTSTPHLSDVSELLEETIINPSQLKFGFLGLGIMGSGMVTNLINSGHSVVVWNRSPDKCKKFVKVGANHGLTPSEVVQVADITFSCVANPQAAKDIVFGNCGVLCEIGPSKGYVEMTNIDAETSKDIAKAITNKGGRYLEAQVQGSETQAEDGTLLVLAAGDQSLFDDCQSCLEAMGKKLFFLGDLGNASKMNVVLQLMTNVCLAGLAEGMALADRAGLQQRDILEILTSSNLNCPLIYEKGNAIINGGFPTRQALQHITKDLKLSLGMGDGLDHPLPVTAAANEFYKYAKRLG